MDRFRESVSDLAKRRRLPAGPPHGPATSPHRPFAGALGVAPCSGQATTPAEIPIRRPPAASSSSSRPSSRSAICTPSTVVWFGVERNRRPPRAEGLSTRRTLSRRAAPTPPGRPPPPARPPAAPGRRRRRRRARRGARSAWVSISWSRRRRIWPGRKRLVWAIGWERRRRHRLADARRPRLPSPSRTPWPASGPRRRTDSAPPPRIFSRSFASSAACSAETSRATWPADDSSLPCAVAVALVSPREDLVERNGRQVAKIALCGLIRLPVLSRPKPRGATFCPCHRRTPRFTAG